MLSLYTYLLKKLPKILAIKPINLDVFGVDRVPVDSSLLFRKAGMFSDDQVENIDQLLSHPGISSEASLYSDLVSDLPYL